MARAVRALRVMGVEKGAGRSKPTPASSSDWKHLVSVIQKTARCSRSRARVTLNNLLGTIAVTLKRNQRVQLPGFGAFEVRTRKARIGRNPQTGAAIKIKASKRIRFRAGETLRRAV